MSVEKATWLFFVQRPFYTIEIRAREKGYHFCAYRIMTKEEYKGWESSGKKIFQRLVRTFILYREQFSENEMNTIIHDLEGVSKKLMLPEAYAKTKIVQLKNDKHDISNNYNEKGDF